MAVRVCVVFLGIICVSAVCKLLYETLACVLGCGVPMVHGTAQCVCGLGAVGRCQKRKLACKLQCPTHTTPYRERTPFSPPPIHANHKPSKVKATLARITMKRRNM